MAEPSAPIIVIARIKVRPETAPTVVEAARACIMQTRQETACLVYDCQESVTEPGAFVFVEEWRDQAGLDAHMKTAHVKALMVAITPCLIAAPTVTAITGGTRAEMV